MKFDGRKYFSHYDTEEVIYPPDDYMIAEKGIKKHDRKSKQKVK